MAKANRKKRAEKYDPKVSIKGTFEQVIALSVSKKEKAAPAADKKKK